MYQLIDTHAHLDEVQELDAALERAEGSGVIAVIAVGVDYKSNQQVLELAQKYPNFVFAGLGCHPQNLPEIFAEIERDLKFIEANVKSAVAVGEVGLDYHKKVRKRLSKETQHQVFADVLAIAKKADKPASIHSRYAWRDCFEIARQSGITRAVFHWYSGPSSVLREIHQAGYFTSATPAVEYGAEHSQAIEQTPLDKLMLETDSPVVYHRGTDRARPSEPADIAGLVLEAVANVKNLDKKIVARNTTENAVSFFRLPIESTEK